jgi:hypothetical protein
MKAHDLLVSSDLCMQVSVITPIDPDEPEHLSAYAAHLFVRKLWGLR